MFSDFVETLLNRITCEITVWSLSSVVELVAQGYCTTWVGLALLSCQCDAALSGALVLYLVHCFVAMKPVTPLLAQAEPQLKPPSPLRVRIGCFPFVIWLLRCCRFQRVLLGGAQW